MQMLADLSLCMRIATYMILQVGAVAFQLCMLDELGIMVSKDEIDRKACFIALSTPSCIAQQNS